MNKKLISVAIPVYDDLEGLKETLDSLNLQTLPKENYEIMVANDGGDEQTTAFCEDKSIQVIEIKPNQGSYHARNEAIKASSSPCLAFIDAGVIAEKNWLVNGLNHLSNYDYVAGDVKIISDQVVDIATFHDYLTAFPMKTYFDKIGFGGAGNLFVKRALFEKAGYFDDRLMSCGDLEFGNRIKSDLAIKKFFAEDCICYHSPRGHKAKVSKMKRVKEGQKKLIELYGERFAFLQKRKGPIQKLKAVLPRSWRSVNEIYKQNKRFSKLQLYLYMYKIKFIKTINDL